MTNTIPSVSCQNLGVIFAVADILTMNESVTDKRNVYEGQAI